MPCDGEVQRIIEFHHLAQLLQVVIDAVQDTVILPPLLVRGFCRDDGEEEGRAFPFVAVGNLLQRRLPGNGDFLACGVLTVSEAAVLDILSCQAEDIVAPHALGIDREQEDVAGEDYALRLTAQVKVTQAFHFIERQAVPVFLDTVAHVHALEWVAVGGKTVVYGKFIYPFQIPYIEGYGIASQLLILQPCVVVAHQQGVEVLERHFILA